ncbi:LysE family transporter [Thalassospira lucentensis]|uniref:LysE family transporter n=1 Tax=Thalassospira lucentensis TaxID=168935 RepID=UPI00142E3C7F|nr:LysE family transporter [Thalassospira lucentensis]NIZ00476.1 LysE family transporter [Thalassospira lucentensis]
MIELFVSAFGLGFLFNAAPGAIFVESLRRGMVGGFSQAFAVQIGSLIGDLIWAALGLLGVAAIFTLAVVKLPMAILGTVLLGWMALQSFRDAMGDVPVLSSGRSTGHQPGRQSAFVAGAGLSLSNPLNITYWTALGGTISALGVSDPGGAAFFVFLAGFMLSSVLWCFMCAAGIGWTRRYASPFIWRFLNLTCAIGLLFFAGLILYRVVAV